MRSLHNYYYLILPKGTLTLVLLTLLTVSICFAQAPSGLTGTIAYFKDGRELHLVNPDGTNDHVIWKNPESDGIYASTFISWRPDGKEIVFISAHEKLSSIFDADIYGIKPDGTGLRRITNAPKAEDLTTFPKGSVEVKIVNGIDWSNFFLYVAGADYRGSFVLNPGYYNTFTIDNVADFGDGARQALIVFDAYHGKMYPGIPLDIQAGQTVVHPGQVEITGNGISNFNPITPSWKNDGSQIIFDLGTGNAQVIDVNPPLLNPGVALFPNSDIAMYYPTLSPINNDIIYSDRFALETGIYKISFDGSQSESLINLGSDICEGISWLPDGSGFIFVDFDPLETYSHLYSYDFNSRTFNQITNLSNALAIRPSVSPDGQYVSYTRYTPGANPSVDVWIMNIDGSNSWKLASDADFSAWGLETSTNIKLGFQDSHILSSFELEQNFPNPFNPSTQINYSINQPGFVEIIVYNSKGEKVKTLVEEIHTSGEYSTVWNGTNDKNGKVSSGIFFYQVKVNGEIKSKKMIFTK